MVKYGSCHCYLVILKVFFQKCPAVFEIFVIIIIQKLLRIPLCIWYTNLVVHLLVVSPIQPTLPSYLAKKFPPEYYDYKRQFGYAEDCLVLIHFVVQQGYLLILQNEHSKIGITC